MSNIVNANRLVFKLKEQYRQRIDYLNQKISDQNVEIAKLTNEINKLEELYYGA